jgi:subtilisin family serine protease
VQLPLHACQRRYARILPGVVGSLLLLLTVPLAVPAGGSDLHSDAAACRLLSGVHESSHTGYIVRFSDRADVRAEMGLIKSINGTVVRQFTRVLSGVEARLSPAQAECLALRPGVLSVEPNGQVYASAVARDSEASATEWELDGNSHGTGNPPWGLDRIDQRSLPLSGGFTAPSSASGITVFIVDTGIRQDHVDFQGRVGPGFTAIDDGTGTSDCNGHGTHVAGTTGGHIYGVAKSVQLIPVRVLGCNGSGTVAGVIAGLDWIAEQGEAPAIVNMSLGGSANASLDAAVANLASRGFLVVVAAGNASADACNYSPARVAEALTVGSSDVSDSMSSFSNSGPCVDIFAPGSSVVSTWNTSSTATASLSGTSMASPHVAGVAAVMLAGTTALSPLEVGERIKATATAGMLTGLTSATANSLVFLGAGTPSSGATVPAAPTSVSAVAARKAAEVTWSLPDDGGSALTEQRVTLKQGRSVAVVVVSPSATTVTVTGLKANQTYSITVRGVNALGLGAESVAVTVTPLR